MREQNHALIGNLSGEVDGPVYTHNLLIGMEFDWFVVNRNRDSQSIPGLDPALTFDPTTGAQPFPSATPISSSFAANTNGYSQNRFGIHLQDIIEVADRWTVMGGVRWDSVSVKYDRELLFGGFPIFAPPQSEETFDHFTPRAGVVYDLVPGEMSLYGLYTQSFAPPGRNIYAQAPLQAETGEMWEGGIKTLLDENLTFTVSGFLIERENVAVQINNFTVLHTAAQVSKGVELNLVGQWNERFSTVTNYTYADVEQFGPAGFRSLNGRVLNAPFGSGNMWGRYNFIQDELSTFGLALGYVYVGERRGDYITPLRLPSYSRWDLGAYGQYGRWDLAAYVENILDVRHETAAVNQYQVYPGAPVNFRLQVGATF